MLIRSGISPICSAGIHQVARWIVWS